MSFSSSIFLYCLGRIETNKTQPKKNKKETVLPSRLRKGKLKLERFTSQKCYHQQCLCGLWFNSRCKTGQRKPMKKCFGKSREEKEDSSLSEMFFDAWVHLHLCFLTWHLGKREKHTCSQWWSKVNENKGQHRQNTSDARSSLNHGLPSLSLSTWTFSLSRMKMVCYCESKRL